MSARTVIIDCDPGVDDAIALLWALASPSALEVLAITTVAGNVGAAQTARNARIIRRIMSREDVPVHVGAAGPLVRSAISASHFHGETGLGWMPVSEPGAAADQRHSVDAIIEAVMSRPAGSVSIAVMGPMTNLALAFRLQPAIIERIAQVVVMGGARSEGGNITASAEYNVHADPHAAQLVLRSGARCVVMGLDATHQVRATPDCRKAIAGIDTVAARTASGLLDFAVDVQRRLIGPDAAPPLHDPCTIAWLLAPQLFETAPADIRVETESILTLGHTAVEFRLPDPASSRVRWVTGADHARVFDLLTEALSR